MRNSSLHCKNCVLPVEASSKVDPSSSVINSAQELIWIFFPGHDGNLSRVLVWCWMILSCPRSNISYQIIKCFFIKHPLTISHNFRSIYDEKWNHTWHCLAIGIGIHGPLDSARRRLLQSCHVSIRGPVRGFNLDAFVRRLSTSRIPPKAIRGWSEAKLKMDWGLTW